MPPRLSFTDSRWLLATGVFARAAGATLVVALLGWAVTWALRDVF